MYVIELIIGWDWKKHNINNRVSVNFQSRFVINSSIVIRTGKYLIETGTGQIINE